jgi:ribosomal protein S18 acetylase RimI-like enzyme
LYLNEETRGQGIGLELMNKLKFFAQKNSINTIQWQTPNDNLPAIAFYKKLNAVNKNKQRFFWSV